MPIIYNSSVFGQPPQAIPTKDKDEKWRKENLDWAEAFLKNELLEKRERLKKNYNIAQGIIDIEDYISIDTNDYKEVYDTVASELQESLFQENEITFDDLKFYPIVPSIINVLVGEFVKKFDHVKVKAIDELSTNEYYEYKKKLVVDYFKQKNDEEIKRTLSENQMDSQSEEYQQEYQRMFQEKMSLPSIQKFMNRHYRNNFEEWANKMLEQAKHKYKITEKEVESFKHLLIADESYWAINVGDSDLDVEIWNPMDTVCIKPKYEKYTSDGDFIGRQFYTTVNDVISRYKNKIDHRLIEKYESTLQTFPSIADRRPTPDDNYTGLQADRKLAFFHAFFGKTDFDLNSEVLVTEAYWKSQRRMLKLTAVYDGEQITKILDDTFVPTMKPEFNDEGDLIGGEDVEYFYVPQTWGGVKISFSGIGNMQNITDENEYLDKEIFGKKEKAKSDKDDIEKGQFYIDIKPNPYQFTDAFNPFKPKLPVVGCCGFEPGMNIDRPYSLVDKTKAYQVMFNSCLNQVDNFMKTEVGLFYILDQKLIPKNSIDGTWGKNNYLKFLLTAKETQLGVVDGSQTNVEGQQTHQQPTVVDLLKNPQFESRLQLAQNFKLLLFETIGITPQRMGTINSQETATGINQAITNSYSQTEHYFVNHTNLMREFKEILLDAEKYIESKSPVSRVQYLNSDEESVMFEMETDDLLLRRANLFLTSNPDTQRVLDQMRQLAIQNNTSNASILDLFTIIESNNTREIKDTLRQAVINFEKQEEAKRQHEQQLQQQALEAKAAEEEAKRVFEAEQNERDRLVDMYKADVQALGWAKDNDIDGSGINDALEVERFNAEQNKNYSDILNKQYELDRKVKADQEKSMLERTKLMDKQADRASKENIKKLEIQRDYANMKNDEKIAKLQAAAKK